MKNKKRLMLPQFQFIRVQLSFAIIALTLLSVIIVGLLLYMRASTIIEEKVSSIVKQSNLQSLQKIDVQLEQYDRLALQLLMEDEVQAVLNAMKQRTSLTEAVMKANDQIAAIKATDDAIIGIYYIANDEELEKQSSFFSRVSLPERNEEHYERILEAGGKTVFLGLAPSINSDLFFKGRPVLVVGKSLKRVSDNTVLGSIIIEINATSILDTLASQKLDNSSYAYFTNAAGDIVIDENIDMLNQSSLVETFSSEDEANETREHINGESYIVLRHTSQLTGWTLVTMTAVKGVMQDIAELRGWLVALGFLLAIVGTLVSYFIARRFGKPLEQLKSAMEDAENGNLTVRATIVGKDELGQVGQSFNRMLEELQRVVMRTQQSAKQMRTASTSLSEVSINSSTAATEFTHATRQISQGALQQTEIAETGSRKTLELGQQMNVLAAAGKEIAAMTNHVSTKSEIGVNAMKEIQINSLRSRELLDKLFGRMDELNKNASFIEKVLQVMVELSKQTNILSLNAGIEAARSGASGKSFVVIADEINQLSLQTKQSIDQVAKFMNGIRQEIQDTNQFLLEAKPIFQNQLQGTVEAEQLFGEMAIGMQDLQIQLGSLQQSIVVLSKVEQELNDVVHHVAASAQQNAASAQQMHASADEQQNGSVQLATLSTELKYLSEQLHDSIAMFKN